MAFLIKHFSLELTPSIAQFDYLLISMTMANIGHRIFDDYENRKESDSTEDRVLSIGMIILYFLCNPMAFFDYSKYRRFNPWIILTKE